MDSVIETTEQEADPNATNKNWLHIFWTKLTHWEYWPFSVFYFPIVFYWVWLCIRARSFFFFTASNPTIEFGGMLGESKDKIFDLIPDQYIPKTIKVGHSISINEITKMMKDHQLTYPLIFKPDIGERGWMVELIKNEADASSYLARIKVAFLIQEYIPYDIELGIFYYRYPDRPRGTISSIVMKDMLSVIGNGTDTVAALMNNDVRSKMHLDSMQQRSPDLLKTTPALGERVEINSIGNHSLGTKFLNGNHLINEHLIKTFNHVSSQIEGFYFGRYDLRCASLEDLYQGKNFKIRELNGAGSEPAHIYHPGFSLWQAYKDIIHHLEVLADISIQNKKDGHQYMPFTQGIREIMKIRKYNKQKPK